jgi:hypothetical protein
MMVSTRRSTSRIDICDYSTLLYHGQDSNINLTKNYLLSHPPPPMTYRDLRSVMSNKIPSNVFLPESLSPSKTITSQSRQKSSHRRKHKRQGVDVYRSLIRTDSRCSALSDRDITNDEMMLLANSFVIDHISPSPASGFFHPQNLPNIQKQRINNDINRIGSSTTKSSYSSSPSLRIQHVGNARSSPSSQVIHRSTPSELIYRTTAAQAIHRPSPPQLVHRPTPPELIHRTTPVDIQYEENPNQMTITTTTTMISSPISAARTRKQLHIYMPQIISC